jgi:phosphoribosylcarboxyaminoimidazole (NCAIR) mutase
VLSQYQKTGSVYGIPLEAGLQDGDALENVLFTPTDKAEEGHDMPIDAEGVRGTYHAETMLFLQAFAEVSAYAKGRGIIMADGKGESGRDRNGVARIGDEFGTPDSCRFWDAAVWRASRALETRKAPPPFDKQKVRAWGITLGINKLDPTNAEHRTHVHSLVVSEDLIAQTTEIYRYIFWRLTGKTLEAYTREELEVMVPFRKKKIAIIAGSESDMPVVSQVVASALNEHRLLSGGVMSYSTYVISCHRNPADLDAFAESGCEGADVAICVGGMALALPGVLDALLYSKGKRIPVIGVALGEPGTRAYLAAALSIEQLPGSPVVIDEQKERVYCGPEGLMSALLRVRDGEMPPAKDRPHKPALRGLNVSDYIKA